MVDDNVTSLIAPEPVGLPSSFVAYTETEVADYGVVGAQRHLVSGYAYPLSGGCLSGKSEVARGDAQGGVEKDGPCDIEHHCAGAFLHHGMTQCAGMVAVLKRGDMVDFAATASGGITPEAFGSGKRYERVAGKNSAGEEEGGECRDDFHGIQISDGG